MPKFERAELVSFLVRNAARRTWISEARIPQIHNSAMHARIWARAETEFRKDGSDFGGLKCVANARQTPGVNEVGFLT